MYSSFQTETGTAGEFSLSGAARASVLVIDDQPLNIQTVYQVLGGAHEVLMATSGAAGVEACVRQLPDLVLLDLVMPGMDGMAVARHLKANPATRDIPIIFLTASTDAEQEAGCWEAGAVDFVCKPFNPMTLQRRVQVHLTIKRQAEALRRLAYLDGLTGIPNRRYFDEQAEAELARARRGGYGLTLMLGDVDFFKRYNDCYGHQAGDQCLRQVAGALQAGLRRPADFVARYGGEEFALLLPGLPAGEAAAQAERLCQQVRSLELPHAMSDAGLCVSASIGAVSVDHCLQLSLDQLLRRADEQLYHAKSAGRDRAMAAHWDGL